MVCSLCVIIDRFTQFNKDSLGMNNGNLLNELVQEHVLDITGAINTLLVNRIDR